MIARASFCTFVVCCVCAAAGSALFAEAIEALKHADFPTAERKLKAELQAQPNEVEALSFLGVALDSQKKFAEAATFHQRALALAPRSGSVLDKYANHFLVSGDEPTARKTFLKALALDATDGYANLQLALLALKDRRGPEALGYLNRLSTEQQSKPDVAIDRLVALELSGRYSEGTTLASSFQNDENWIASAGRSLAVSGEPKRARILLEDASIRHPRSFAVQYSLAYVYDALQLPADALRLLTQAAQLAPDRADVQKSLAIASGNFREYKQSFAAWAQYVKLTPADDAGRRERGFAAAHVGQFDSAITDLNWYTARHPRDAEGWYELGIAESAKDPTRGMPSLSKAVTLQPDFALARSARGALYYREGKPEAALPDMERAVVLDPQSSMIQYRLGQVYLALDRRTDALRSFQRAAELAPNDYPAQFHYANALADAGRTAEADAILERIRTWPTQNSNSDLLDATTR